MMSFSQLELWNAFNFHGNEFFAAKNFYFPQEVLQEF